MAIIDLLYSITIKTKELLSESGSKFIQISHFLGVIGSYAAAITFNVKSYGKAPKWLAITNSVAIGMFFLAALVNINPTNTILMSGLFAFYIQILTY